MSTHSALVIGCTGLVGKTLVEILIKSSHYEKIKLVSRSPLEIDDERVEEIILNDFDQLESVSDHLHANDYFCCLGTTIKKAKTKDNYRKIDLEFPMRLAKMARQSTDLKQFLIVTAAGANANSPLFYNRIKGELENQLRQLNFPTLMIFRPSILIGNREEFRFGEEFAKAFSAILSFFMVGLKRRLWAIKAEDVAQSMYLIAKDQRKGVRVLSSSDMRDRLKSLGF